MKKVFALVVLLLVASLLVMPVFAASAHMSVSVSKSTVTRGDTFTITVSTGTVENCFSGGFMLSYNTGVFEYVDGSALVSGFAMSGVTPMAGNVSGYFMNTSGGSTVSGSLFQITLKVKDNAAYGSYTISGTPNMTILNGSEKESVSCSAGSATVTVVCNHSYGAVTKLDDNSHGKTCSLCGDVQKENHDWKVTGTKPSTCKAEGETSYECSVCKATKTESIPVDPDAHKYGAVTKLDDNSHGKTCSLCGDVQKENHTWNVTGIKPSTCKDEGVTTYACSVCKGTKAEPISVDPNAHKYGSVTRLDDEFHGKTCALCGDVRKESHNYKTTWSKDKTNHWHECSVCKDQIDLAKHIPGPEATEENPQVCTVCQYIIKPALQHTHDYANKWTTDENGHWYTCSGCEEKGSYADHDFENACDKDCSVCGYTRETEHKFSETWTTDASNHWHECTGCGLKQDEAAHEPGPEATDTTAQTCTICGYEIAPALGEPATQVPTVQEDPAADNGSDFPWWIVLAAVAVLGVGAVVVVAIKKKKG